MKVLKHDVWPYGERRELVLKGVKATEKSEIEIVGFNPKVTFTSLANGAMVSFETDSSTAKINCPIVNPKVVGLFSLTGQTTEDKDGTPIALDCDMLGVPRALLYPTVGPIEKLSGKTNVVKLIVGSRVEEMIRKKCLKELY